MASENETVADIVKEKRDTADEAELKGKNTFAFDLAKMLREEVNRIEAAHQREVAELKRKMNDVVCENEALRDACGTCGAKREREATSEKSSQVGNAAKMREAFDGGKVWIDLSIQPDNNLDFEYVKGIVNRRRKMNPNGYKYRIIGQEVRPWCEIKED